MAENFGVGDEQVVAHQLDFLTHGFGDGGPTGLVVLAHGIFDGEDGEFADQVFIVFDHAFGIERFALAGEFVFAVFVELTGGGIKRQHHFVTGPVTGGFNGFADEVQRGFGAAEVGGETALVADRRVEAGIFQLFFERVENLGTDADGFAHAGGLHRHDHEFLDVDGVIGMRAAVDDVHHRHGEDVGIDSADIAEERLAGGLCGGLGHGHRDAEHGVGAEFGFVVGAIELDQQFIERGLVHRIGADQFLEVVDVGDGFQHAFAQIAGFITIAQFQRFVGAGGCPRRHGSAAGDAIL